MTITSSLLDALVLAVVRDEDTYGYKITQEVREVMDVSESTLYPVLRRLQRDAFLEVYDREYSGRNRRYYRLTSKGQEQLASYAEEWEVLRDKFDRLMGGASDE
jgi:PadR family transcriptional regulator PadR